MARRKTKKKTDVGTIFFHWLIVVTLFFSTITGLRIGLKPSDETFGIIFETLLPTNNIWLLHLCAGTGIIGVLAAYPFYMRNSGLGKRIVLDWARLYGLWVGGPARWAAVNIILYWLLFGLIVFQVISGLMMHRGMGGPLVAYHLWATYAVIGYVVAHILGHFAFGGVNQLLRVFRPAAPPVAGNARPLDSDEEPTRPPFIDPRVSVAVGSLIVGLSAIIIFFSADQASRDILKVQRVLPGERPTSFTDLSGPGWRRAQPIRISTQQGANFADSGTSDIDIRAIHDGDRIWFTFTWQDPTRSLKHKPLIKLADGWRVLTRQQDLDPLRDVVKAHVTSFGNENSEDTYFEDRFAVMLSRNEKVFGPGAFHVGVKPLADKPKSSSGRGLHYTTDGSFVELIEWHAASGNNDRQCDHKYIGSPVEPSKSQRLNREAYKGGILADPNHSPVMDNIDIKPLPDGEALVRPRMLPVALPSVEAAMQPINLDADLGERDGAAWWIQESEAVPYSEEADRTIPPGTLLPGVISRNIETRWPELLCSAQWSAGRWTLVASRPVAATNLHDVPLNQAAYMWVAAFDHVPARHTRHVRPIKLEVQ